MASTTNILAPSSAEKAVDSFPGWPVEFQGKALTRVPMLPRESRFYQDFEGKIARFTDGERQIIIRWVGSSSRQFHLTSRCFRAIGYTLSPLPAHKDSDGGLWGAFRAERVGETLEVQERISDSKGRSWSDESAWRWDTFWNRTSGPWWAYTIAQSVSTDSES